MTAGVTLRGNTRAAQGACVRSVSPHVARCLLVGLWCLIASVALAADALTDAHAAYARRDYAVAVQRYDAALPDMPAGDARDLATLNCATCTAALGQHDRTITLLTPLTRDLPVASPVWDGAWRLLQKAYLATANAAAGSGVRGEARRRFPEIGLHYELFEDYFFVSGGRQAKQVLQDIEAALHAPEGVRPIDCDRFQRLRVRLIERISGPASALASVRATTRPGEPCATSPRLLLERLQLAERVEGAKAALAEADQVLTQAAGHGDAGTLQAARLRLLGTVEGAPRAIREADALLAAPDATPATVAAVSACRYGLLDRADPSAFVEEVLARVARLAQAPPPTDADAQTISGLVARTYGPLIAARRGSDLQSVFTAIRAYAARAGQETAVTRAQLDALMDALDAAYLPRSSRPSLPTQADWGDVPVACVTIWVTDADAALPAAALFLQRRLASAQAVTTWWRAIGTLAGRVPVDHPQHATLLWLAGQMAHRAGLQGNGNPEALGAANDCYTQVLTRHPAAPEAAFALTGSLQVCAALGREGEASARLADLCRTATAPSLLVSVADAAYQSGAEPGWRLAVIGYRRAAEIAPTDSNAPLWLWRATCAAQRIGDVAEATRLQGALRAGYPTSRWAALPPPEVPR